MTTKKLVISPKIALLAVSFFILAVRLSTLPFPDLVDTTEGRYAGVAQLMSQRDDWVTPWIHYEGVDQPYLGKPPLHFWLIQTAFLIFGENNFGARLPGVVSSLGIGITLAVGALALLGWEAAIVTTIVFATSCMTFFLSGAVLLDVTLTLGLTIALIGILRSDQSRIAGYSAFFGLTIGVLTKGPLACILAGLVVVPWAIAHRVLTKRWPIQLTKLPWVPGIILFFMLVLPWYLWAESRNPGFLEYFLWNENIGRYLHSDYVDEYGSGHRQPFGAAILMTLLALFPWSFILVGFALPHLRWLCSRNLLTTLRNDSSLLFALCWTLGCPTLLLGAEQYTATYVMPVVPGFALLAGILWNRYRTHATLSSTTIHTGLSWTIAAVLVVWIAVTLTSSWFLPNITVIIGSLGLALWIGLIFRYVHRTTALQGSGLERVFLLGLVTTLAYGAVVVSLDNFISTNRSSKRVLTRAKTLHGAETSPIIGFPYYFPFSASFYAPSILGSTENIIDVRDGHLIKTEADLLIVRKRNLNKLYKELPTAKEIASLGQWRIIKPVDKSQATSGTFQ